MKDVRISLFQLLALMTLFLLGSTLIVGLNFDAGEDSAFPVLIQMVLGTALFYFYMLIVYASKGKPFVPLLKQAFGNVAGRIIAVIYALYFLYIAGRVLRDFAFFITQMIYSDTPMWMISIPLIFVVGYSILLGLESVARCAEIMVFVVMGVYLLLWGLSFFSEEFEPGYLLPLFQLDWRTLWTMIVPQGITFPFGELVVFLVILPQVNQGARLRRYVWIPIMVSGFISVVCMELVIGILHIPFAKDFVFPFITALQMVTYPDLIEHLEIYTSLIQLIGGFIKIFVFFYGAHVIFAEAFAWKQTNLKVLLLSVAIFIFSMITSSNLAQHLEVGLKIVPYYFHLPLQIGVPFLLGGIVLWKKRKPLR